MPDSAHHPPAAPTNHRDQRDFHVELLGDVAVTSFTDHSTLLFHGLTLQGDFRSTEVWHETRGTMADDFEPDGRGAIGSSGKR
jgi:hypothetical protein